MTLAPIDPNNSVVVTSYLEKARQWLATAVEKTGPAEIAAAKAEIATAAEATKQLNLSKEIQLDAKEMVRRAEYALAKAIRKGQEDGTVAKTGDTGSRFAEESTRNVHGTDLASPTDFARDVELYDRPSQQKTGILGFADNATPEEFDAALAAAKEEGNLSRANVRRKIDKKSSAAPTREDKANQVRDLAAKGWTSEQIRKEVGYSRLDTVRELAREFDIEIPADAVRGRARRFDHARVLDNVTEAVEVAAMSLRDVDAAHLDKEEALERLDSLTTSIHALSKAVKKIKESFRDQ